MRAVGHFVNEAQKLRDLERFIKERGLGDAIFYDYWLVDATLALAVLKRKGVIHRTIARVHGFDLYDERQFEGCVPFRDYRVEYLDAVFAVSEHGYQYMRRKLLPHLSPKVRLAYLGVADPGVRPTEAKRREGPFVIVSCARLIALKRMSLLADVLRRCSLEIHWIHFGGGPLRAELDAAVRKLPENITVELRGETENASVLDLYQKCQLDLFVSLSESEGIPGSMVEAI